MTSKSQSIVVRITQDEYDRLQPEISASGSRSLHELARAKVLRAVGEPSLAGVAQKLSALETAIARLEHALIKSEIKSPPALIKSPKDRQPSHGSE